MTISLLDQPILRHFRGRSLNQFLSNIYIEMQSVETVRESLLLVRAHRSRLCRRQSHNARKRLGNF